MPFTATIAPSSSARAVASSASRAPLFRTAPPPAYTSLACGPQSGHAFGCAWKRRFSGSRYSARQAGHISNEAIVVLGRS